MGSTGLFRPPGKSDRAFFENELGTGRTIIDCATLTAGGEWQKAFYAAIKNDETVPYAPDQTWGLVVLMTWARGSSCNFYFKYVDETMGPSEDDCPARILDLLSPTDSTHANEWRGRCRANAERKERAAKLQSGTVIRFAQPLPFPEPYGEVSMFRLVKAGRRRWWEAVTEAGVTRFRARIGADWWRRDYELVPS